MKLERDRAREANFSVEIEECDSSNLNKTIIAKYFRELLDITPLYIRSSYFFTT
jgi:hypothetical protein